MKTIEIITLKVSLLICDSCYLSVPYTETAQQSLALRSQFSVQVGGSLGRVGLVKVAFAGAWPCLRSARVEAPPVLWR